MIDRAGLAAFLRHRRESLQPEDVGLPRGQRRRTSGLRREEVAALCHMSTDYYARLERERGPQPSEQMIASIAQGLHLSLDERDHLFRLAGHHPPARGADSEHISPGILRILDRLADTPAEIVTELGETLRQTPLGVALIGDATRYTGPARSNGYRWFTDPAARRLYAPEDHAFLSRMYAAGLREIAALRGPGSRAAYLADLLLAQSEEFRRVWNDQEIGVRPHDTKRFVHPELGRLELNCQRLSDPQQSHHLMVYTAVPGSESYDKLQLLSVIGTQMVGSDVGDGTAPGAPDGRSAGR
jgi:transcriptional regulator with XRE-family HTH domain